MRLRLVAIIAAGCLILIPLAILAAGPLHVGSFSTGDLSGWSDKTFKGKTDYSLVEDNGRTVLKAHSAKAASGLVKKVSVDPRHFPVLRWSWKVEHIIQKEDIARKGGDDFAARVYVVFPRTFFWRMRAINYVWSSKMTKGSSAPSPYTKNAMIVAVESGGDKVGSWVNEERNILDDYRKLFGEEPPEIGAVAVMTDTDDTREDATAYYGDIFLEGNPAQQTARTQ